MSHLHVRYVTKKYCAAVIVFNVYDGDPTTKYAMAVHFDCGMMSNRRMMNLLIAKLTNSTSYTTSVATYIGLDA